MQFTDYYNKIKKYMTVKGYNPVIVDKSLNKLFDNYVNDITMNESIKMLLKSTLTESKNGETLEYRKYNKRVKQLLETMGYDKKQMTPAVEKKISDSYDMEEDEYSCAELCKSDIEKEEQYNVIKITPEKIEQIKNNLIINFHSIQNAAILSLNVSPTAAKLSIKIRLFSNLSNIETDVKSYIKKVHKYLSSFVAQNQSSEIDARITGYSIKFNNLYCTTDFVIPFNQLNLPCKFNLHDIFIGLRSYLNIIEIFSEQYKDMINK